jgi:hypothetical protein
MGGLGTVSSKHKVKFKSQYYKKEICRKFNVSQCFKAVAAVNLGLIQYL